MTKNENRKGTAKKVIILALAFILAIGCAIGGTIAWLTDKTDTVKNTFTTSGIDITLIETGATDDNSDGTYDNEFEMVPGYVHTKDPMVTVLANSEACYLFVEITESADFDEYMTYAVAEDWTALDGQDGVYYRVVEKSEDNQEFYVIKDNEVTVKTTLTNENMPADAPTLTFTAYASQYYKNNDTEDNTFTAAEAWANIP